MNKNLIGLNGFIGSGKSTVANYLKKKYDYELVSFADPLKTLISALYDVPLPLLELEDFKNQPSQKFQGKTYRKVLQETGTFYRSLSPDTWVNYARTKVNALLREGKKVCISDIRYFNELQIIKDLDGYLVYIERRKALPATTKILVETLGANKLTQLLLSLVNKKLAHESEFNTFKLKLEANVVIYNNFSNMIDLEKCVDHMLAEM